MTTTEVYGDRTQKVAAEPRTGCTECGTTERPLMAESPSRSPEEARGKQLYCMECNPRFGYLDAVFTGLERMES
jgi:hypothetical protein